MYSLVSAPVLGFDLVRTRGGARAADILLRALAVDAEELDILSALYSEDEARASAWLELSRTEEPTSDLSQLAVDLEREAAVGGEGTAGRLRLLESARVGTLGGLLRCVRNDVFDWTWRHARDLAVQGDDEAGGVAVVCDAVAAGYAGHRLSSAASRRLGAPWVAAVRRLPDRTADLGPNGDELSAMLRRLAVLDAGDRARLAAASARSRAAGSTDWAAAVHDASWAVHLSGRVRQAAAAQLAAVCAVTDAQVPVMDLATGTWNLVSGAVHAVSVRDVVPPTTLATLLGPWVEALGPVA